AFAKSTAPDVGDVAGAKPKPASAAAPNAKAQQPAQSAATNSGGGSGGARTNGPTPTDRLKSQLFEREGKPESASAVRAAQSEFAGGPKVCGKDHVTKVHQAQAGLKRRIIEIQRKAWHPGTPPWERQALLRELSEASKLLDKTEEFVK
ncbi:MAG: hypothetical protein DPW14_15550, partial [Planctomycetes bacterium]|nr:hypothetical protein [Planctomycetota bacterium]